jgi:hydroxymethylpyrimidine/phosphomethylpyrimidine kinase
MYILKRWLTGGFKMIKVLTIAGSDCSGGAGIQADIKTMTALGAYAMSAVTALTAQNTTGVYGILESDPEFLSLQLDCIFRDIYPDAVKIGMVSNRELIGVIAGKLREYGAKNIVVDPVMVSTSGSSLLGAGAEVSLVKDLMPLADLVTPNIPEAEKLTGMKIDNKTDMEMAAKVISDMIPGWVLLKGGHLNGSADDLLCRKNELIWISGKRIDSNNTHGTGCTLSSALAVGLARGMTVEESAIMAKKYVAGALGTGLNLGKGSGPLNHCFDIQRVLRTGTY